MKAELMTKDERSLLCYLETIAVDHGGIVDTARMNADDFKIAESWKEVGFLKEWRRVPFKLITKQGWTHMVQLSESAWNLAHQARRIRGDSSRSTGFAKDKWDAVEQTPGGSLRE